MFLFSKKNSNSVNVNDLSEKLGNVSLIDIREVDEYTYGHVPTALNIPMNTILEHPQTYLNKEKEYYIICQSGNRSFITCNLLSKQGYKVINVVGGTGGYRGKLEY